MAISAPALLLWPLLFSSFVFSSSSTGEQSIVAHPSVVRLSSGQHVGSSPPSKSSMVVQRVHIHGLSRLQNLAKYAHSLKVKVDFAQSSTREYTKNVEICFHGNTSLGLGMCFPGDWEKLKGSWARLTSPFSDRFVDIRASSQSFVLIEVSTEEVYLWYRVIFLVLGIILLILAPTLSRSIVFYYSSAMVIGVILVILMVLFQGMKLLPTGKKSSLAIFLYSSIVGIGSFLLHYLSGVLRSALTEIGISEEMFNPIAFLFLVCLIIAGAWLGFWTVRKFVLAEDGSVDVSVATFIKWSIWIFSIVMILQSSSDTILATAALVSVIVVLAFVRMIFEPRVWHCMNKFMHRTVKSMLRFQIYYPVSYDSPADYGSLRRGHSSRSQMPRPRAKSFALTTCSTPLTGSTNTSQRLSETETYYSTFHDTPERKHFSKEEWEAFTRDSTQRALQGLVASPDFTNWAVANADRITLTPKEDPKGTQKRLRSRWLHWW